MQKLACEMCGSTNIIKQNGLYVCQSCGTKYSPEDAKKMMSEGVVDVKGTVKVDNSSDIENLRTLLHRAKNDKQWKEVADYSNQILVKNPNDWEAIFYKEVGEVYIASLNNLNSELMDLKISSENSLRIINEQNINVNVEDIKIDFAKLINEICVICFATATKHVEEFKVHSAITIYFNTLENCMILTDYAVNMANVNESLKIDMYKNIVLYSQSLTHKKAFYQGTQIKIVDVGDFRRKQALTFYNKYVELLEELDSEYQPPAIIKKNNNNGCYIATSVYGSYDCPEVWTLRRYRDNKLNKTIFGKLFIKIYYMASPTLVKWFGDKKWFNNLFKNRLDKKVEKLQEEGFESTFYVD